MDQICLVVPITVGKTDDAREFMRELEGKPKPDYDRSERRIGVTKEVWYLARTPAGDQFVAFVEARDFAGARFGSVIRRPSAKSTRVPAEACLRRWSGSGWSTMSAQIRHQRATGMSGGRLTAPDQS